MVVRAVCVMAWEWTPRRHIGGKWASHAASPEEGASGKERWEENGLGLQVKGTAVQREGRRKEPQELSMSGMGGVGDRENGEVTLRT